jgi:hypothetical protein
MASLNDLKSQYYTSLGFHGSIADQEYAYYSNLLGLPLGNAGSLADMKYKYYTNPVVEKDA